MAMQIDRESLDRRAAMAWTATSAISATRSRLSLKAVALTIAIALAGLSGTAVAVAEDDHPATSAETGSACGQGGGEFAVIGAANVTGQDLGNMASVAPQLTDDDGDVIPMPLSGGRRW
jgi:hypothetical protein